YVVSGKGTLQIGGELSSQQEITLQVDLTDPAKTTTNKLFTNDVRTIDRPWPVLDLHLVQTDPNPLPFYSLHLLAAPVRELWFSTAAGLTASKWQSPTNHVSAGDLIADSGRVIRSSGE